MFFDCSSLPDTPTSSKKKNLTSGDGNQYLIQLNNSYTTVYGDHKISGSCAMNLYFYDSDGIYISFLDTILNLPNIIQRSASITVPNNTAFCGIGIRSAATTNVDVWFS